MSLGVRHFVLAFFGIVLMSRRATLAPNKRYDRAYFDRWYRASRTRIDTPQSLARKVRLAVSVAEYFLGRHIESVLDIGCGEGRWYSPLRRMRPRARYTGVDSSEYAV